MSDNEWHNITKYNLIMLLKLNDNDYDNQKFISWYFSDACTDSFYPYFFLLLPLIASSCFFALWCLLESSPLTLFYFMPFFHWSIDLTLAFFANSGLWYLLRWCDYILFLKVVISLFLASYVIMMVICRYKNGFFIQLMCRFICQA